MFVFILTVSLLGPFSVAQAYQACLEGFGAPLAKRVSPFHPFTGAEATAALNAKQIVRFDYGPDRYYGEVVAVSENGAVIKTALAQLQVGFGLLGQSFHFAESAHDHKARLNRLAESLPKTKLALLQTSQQAAETGTRVKIRVRMENEVRVFEGIIAKVDADGAPNESLAIFTKLEKVELESYSASGELVSRAESNPLSVRLQVGDYDFGRTATFNLNSPYLESIELLQPATRTMNRTLVRQLLGVFGI